MNSANGCTPPWTAVQIPIVTDCLSEGLDSNHGSRSTEATARTCDHKMPAFTKRPDRSCHLVGKSILFHCVCWELGYGKRC